MSSNIDNEFENLFKRASDQYPINSNNADWSAVLQGLEEKKRRGLFKLNKRTTITILLICAFSIISSIITGIIVWKTSDAKHTKIETAQKKSIQQNTSTEKKIAADVYEKVMLEIKNNPTKENQPQEKIKNNYTSIKGKPDHYNSESRFVEQPKAQKNISKVFLNNQKTNSKPVETLQTESGKIFKDSTAILIHTAEINKDNRTGKNDDASSLTINHESNNAIVKVNNHTKYFYAGALYAFDKSSIKLEPNKGTGYSLALMIGYQFSKNWSVESGLHIEKKELYTNGTNFDKSILNATGNIVWIESEARLLEIPITIKRNLIQKKKHSLFATAGLSSYIVNKETIEYEEEIGGLFQNETVVFNKNTSDIFSTFNLSLGYQYHLGKIGNIRIEPYFNIPIGVIGNSKSPIYSKGIYLGWTYDFNK